RSLVAAHPQPALAFTDAASFPALGLEGTVAGPRLRLGQPAFVLHNHATAPDEASLVLGEEGVLLGAFHMDEKLRADALITINALKALGMECIILSGDTSTRVAHIAQQLGIKHWQGRQMPADKL